MIATMRERMAAKMANRNDNAFAVRRLIKAYDTSGAGAVHFDDFRAFCDAFGMQLDDDSLLALYHVHDPAGTGAVGWRVCCVGWGWWGCYAEGQSRDGVCLGVYGGCRDPPRSRPST